MLHIDVKKQLGTLSLEAHLDIPSQGVTALFGLSGSGKSSLINLVSGLINPDEGVIALNDREKMFVYRSISAILAMSFRMPAYFLIIQ